MIEGVIIKPLKKICDDRGRVMHMLRKDDPEFRQFGEIYFSTAYPGVVKAWHCHKRMTLNYVCVTGMIKLVLTDRRELSATNMKWQEVCMGDHNYCLVSIPPGVWQGWKNIGTTEAILANCSDIPHEPDEMLRFNTDGVEYNWSVKVR